MTEPELTAEEQAALRRVATLVASGVPAAEMFAAVAKEVGRALNVPLISVCRYEPNETVTQVGAWGEENPFPVGTSWKLDEYGLSGLVARLGRAARVAYAAVPGEIAERLAREAGIRSAVGVPIVVEGRMWGVMMALSTDTVSPPGAEGRLENFTELVATAIANAQARDDLRLIADEQGALRRLATEVARGAAPRAVFDAVCEETGRVIGAATVNLVHFSPDGFSDTIAGWSLRDTHVPTGMRLPLDGDAVDTLIQRTAAPARLDSYEGARGELAAVIRARGIRSEIGAPVVVDGQVWGALIAGRDTDDPAQEGAELRLASFAELVATAVSNATARSELVASRARLVTAADDARRRLERNLHDGAQQRLVSLGLKVRAAEELVPGGLAELRSELDGVVEGLESLLEEVREISHGLHPAILSQAGLGAALRSLAARSSVPVEVDVALDERPMESVEIAAYYVVSEALANAAKHAEATLVRVSSQVVDGHLRLTVADDGVGGALADRGSGLSGLCDRVEALGGRLALTSPRGGGTTVEVDLPVAGPSG